MAMQDEPGSGAQTIIPAEHGRYELINVQYEVADVDCRPAVKVEVLSHRPVIAWQVFQSWIEGGTIAVPVGIGLTADNDLFDGSPQRRSTVVTYDRKSGTYFGHYRIGVGRSGWETACREALDSRASSPDLIAEREGLDWFIEGPPMWD
jgi:hypothetical protein